jgi:hypothetical protein
MRIPTTSFFPRVPSEQSNAILQTTGIVGLVGVAVIHFAQIVPTTEETPWLGAAFVVLTMACIAVAAQLIYSSARLVWLQVAVLNILAILGYTFTRLISTSFDNTDVGNWSETLGIAALFIEGLLVILSLHAMNRRPQSSPSPQPREQALAHATAQEEPPDWMMFTDTQDDLSARGAESE